MSPATVFETIYLRNAWNGGESVSGTGSDLQQTAAISVELPKVLKELEAQSMLDVPCGDFYWMRHVQLDDIDYIGADIVDDLVFKNKSFKNERRSFIKCDLMTSDLPPVDVILCRDCLVHFSNQHVWQTLRNIARSEVKYLVTTTFNLHSNDKSIDTGQWRPLNLQAAPFNLPSPFSLIDEHCTQDGGQYPDKMLGVWSVDSIRSTLSQQNQAA
ncbi:MAG: class I SAM-dependent methyltransferase [Planctomycetales bacterium]|jgi:hypothetical protein